MFNCSGRDTIMGDILRGLEAYLRHHRDLNVQEARTEATAGVEAVVAAAVVVEAITDRIYIHMVPAAVRLHVPEAAMVDDDNRIQVADPVDPRQVTVAEPYIMGMVVMAEVSNIIHRKMSRTSQFQRRKHKKKTRKRHSGIDHKHYKTTSKTTLFLFKASIPYPWITSYLGHMSSVRTMQCTIYTDILRSATAECIRILSHLFVLSLIFSLHITV